MKIAIGTVPIGSTMTLPVANAFSLNTAVVERPKTCSLMLKNAYVNVKALNNDQHLKWDPLLCKKSVPNWNLGPKFFFHTFFFH